jgi:hypothetical protein
MGAPPVGEGIKISQNSVEVAAQIAKFFACGARGGACGGQPLARRKL